MLTQMSRLLGEGVLGTFFPLGELGEVSTSVNWGCWPRARGVAVKIKRDCTCDAGPDKTVVIIILLWWRWNIQGCILLTRVMDRGGLALDANGVCLEQRKAEPLRGPTRPRRPPSCVALERTAAIDRGSEAQASKGWSTEWGEPSPSRARRPAEVVEVLEVGHVLSAQGESCAATRLLTSGPDDAQESGVHPHPAPSWNTLGGMHMTESNVHTSPNGKYLSGQSPNFF